MSVLEQLALGWQCLLHALRHAARPALWGPWLVLGLVQALVLAALWGFAHPAISWLMAPLLARMAGEEALHYPTLFRLLPVAFARADVVIAAVLGSLMAGVSTALFAAAFAGRPVPARVAWGRALRRAPALILVQLPVTAIALALAAVLGMAGGGLVGRLAGLIAVGALWVVQSWFLYAAALVVLEERGALSALGALPRAAGRGMAAALLLSAVTLVPLLAIQQIAQRSDAIVDRGVPELVAWVVLAQAGVALAGGFLLTGGATLVFQSAIARRREAGA